jgi:uncharacterized protein (TIGR02145 family)
MKRTFLLFLLIIFTSFIKAQTVTIGKQVWTTKNLNLMTFRNGDSIPHAKTNEEWETAFKNEKPAWCYYDNNPANGEKYGILYNWYAVNDPRGLAPDGFHIPSKTEWDTLENLIGSAAGEKMKSAEIIVSKFSFIEEGGYYEQKYVPCSNCSYWTQKQKENNPCSSCKNTRGKTVSTGKYIPKTKKKIEEKNNIGWNGDNSSGFSGQPGGLRRGNEFAYISESGYWWSVTQGEEDENDGAYFRYLDNTSLFNYDYFNKGVGLSVRCLKN